MVPDQDDASEIVTSKEKYKLTKQKAQILAKSQTLEGSSDGHRHKPLGEIAAFV